MQAKQLAFVFSLVAILLLALPAAADHEDSITVTRVGCDVTLVVHYATGNEYEFSAQAWTGSAGGYSWALTTTWESATGGTQTFNFTLPDDQLYQVNALRYTAPDRAAWTWFPTPEAVQGSGCGDGSTDGTADGAADGNADGSVDGTADGTADGTGDGAADGTGDGAADGSADGDGSGNHGNANGNGIGLALGVGNGNANGNGGGLALGHSRGNGNSNGNGNGNGSGNGRRGR